MTSIVGRKYLCDCNPTSKVFKFSEIFSFEKSELLVLQSATLMCCRVNRHGSLLTTPHSYCIFDGSDTNAVRFVQLQRFLIQNSETDAAQVLVKIGVQTAQGLEDRLSFLGNRHRYGIFLFAALQSLALRHDKAPTYLALEAEYKRAYVGTRHILKTKCMEANLSAFSRVK